MVRRYPKLAIALAFALSGCGRGQQQEANAAIERTADHKPDHLTSVTTRAMCGTAEDRAVAISQVAEDAELNGDPDAVFEVAIGLAKQGCPKPKS